MTAQLELNALKRTWIDEQAMRFATIAPKLPKPFCADHLHALMPEPAHPNWWGGLLAQLQSNGIVRAAGRVTSTRPSANARKVNGWEVVA